MSNLEQHRCDVCDRPYEAWDTEWKYFSNGTGECPQCNEAMYFPPDDPEGDWTDVSYEMYGPDKPTWNETYGREG